MNNKVFRDSQTSKTLIQALEQVYKTNSDKISVSI